MTKSERRLRALFRKWTPILGLTDWDIAVEIAPDDTMDHSGWTQGFETGAETAAHWEYQRAIIRFSAGLVEEDSDAALENTVVHELMHVALNEMRDPKRYKNEERTAVMLTRAFLKAVA